MGVEVYRDAAMPAVSAVGIALGSIVKIVLAPIHLLSTGVDRLARVAEAKLINTPQDRPLTTSQIALQYALLGDGDEASGLRAMFENLLASSIDRDKSRDSSLVCFGYLSTYP